MIRRLSISAFFLMTACTNGAPKAALELLHPSTQVSGVQGLERLEHVGPYEAGAVERFRLQVDEAQIARATFRASAGSFASSGRVIDWTMPDAASAELTLDVVRKDGSEASTSWSFRIVRAFVPGTTLTAEQALLATPMPVLDGGTLEISGGSCEVRYEGNTNNVSLAFTTETHPSLMYGRWNGSSWTLELVDAMGFNTGGLIRPNVSMQVEANGTVHLVYVRDNQLFYAMRNGGVWTRERVDTTVTYTGSQLSESADPSIALNGSVPVILYPGGTPVRPVIAVRTMGSWVATSVSVPGFDTNVNQTPTGELAVDPSGRCLFTATGRDPSNFNYYWRLASFVAPSQTGSVLLTPTYSGRSDTVLLSATRMLVRTDRALLDVAVNATTSSSTFVLSSVELTGGSTEGDLAWSASQNKPVILHTHGSALELVTTNALGYWTFQQLGDTTSVSAGLAVNPNTGDVSVCYQANDRIMFQ